MTGTRKIALIVPLVLVNGVAIWGQAGWAHAHLTNHNGPEDWLVAALFAAAVESIGIYLALEAHAALMANHAAGLLRAGSYGVGLLAGVLNYWHFAGGVEVGAGWKPNAQAITFGILSSISPWLWAIRSRSLNRDRLAELDLVDVRGVKLSTSRKLWHPILSLKVTRWAAWAGVTNPVEAVAGWEATRRELDAPSDTLVDIIEPEDMAAEGVLEIESEPADVPGEQRPARSLSTEEARTLARALRAQHPDMGVDTIAVLVGRSAKQVGRYLSGPEVSANGRPPLSLVDR